MWSVRPSEHRLRRPLAITLAACLLIGLGAGVGFIGYQLWRAAGSAEGLSATSQRWTVAAGLVAFIAALIASAVMGAERQPRRAMANKALWAVAALLLGAGVLTFFLRPDPVTIYDPPVTNAWFLVRLSPFALLIAGVLLAAAATLGLFIVKAGAPKSSLKWPRWVGGALAAGVLVGGGLVWPPLVDARAHQANTVSQSPSDPPGALASDLDGEIAWSTDDYGDRNRMRSTAGGMAVRTSSPGGIKMLDPRTGQVRWSWHRADLRDGVEPMAVSADGTLIAARFQTLDQHPEPPNLVVLDAETGAVQAEFTDAVGSPLAVTADQIVTVTSNKVDLAAYGFDGEQHWSHEMSLPIRNSDEVFFSATDDTLLLTLEAESHGWRSVAVDLGTGESLWQQSAPRGMAPLRIVPGTDLAVTGGVGVPIANYYRPSARVLAVDLADGEEVWERSIDIPESFEGSIDRDGCAARVDVAESHLTFITCADHGADLTLTGLDPATGEPVWEQAILTDEGDWPPRPTGEDPLQAMSDGTTALLVRSPEDGCTIARAGPDGVHRAPLADEEAGGGCDTVRWRQVGETVLIDHPDGLFALT